MIALEEGKSQDEDEEEDGDEGMTTSREDIDRPDDDAEQDGNVSDGDKDIYRDTIRGGGGSEAGEWESGGSYGDEG